MISTEDLSSTECREKYFASVDVARFISAVLVVTIHTNALGDVHPYLAHGLKNYLARLAVPFFFVSGGYFCFRKVDLEAFDPRITWTYAMRMLKLFLIWTGIYVIPILYGASKNQRGIVAGLIYAIQKTIVTGHAQLWYLNATVVAVILITVALQKKVKLEKIVLAGVVLYLIGLWGDSHYGILNYFPLMQKGMEMYLKLFITTRNGLFIGVLLIGMGAMFAHRKIQMKPSFAIGGFIVSMGLLFVEVYTVVRLGQARDFNSYIFLIPSVFFLFYIISHINIRETRFTKKLRVYSSLVYFTHMWIDYPIMVLVVKMIQRITGNAAYRMHSLVRFACVLGCALLISIVLQKLQDRKGFQWIKYLY